MKLSFEAWEDEESVMLSTPNAVSDHKLKGLFIGKEKLLYKIEADTYEEAMAVHHIKMGWEPYKPMGDPQLCPNSCGSYYYPEGSGECPKCGKIC
jgi:hypothetical protein